MARRGGSKDGSFLARSAKKAFRAIFAVIVLAGFVLGIVFSLKYVSDFSIEKIASLSAPYLSRLGISADVVGEVAGDLISRATDLGVEGKNSVSDSSSSQGEIAGSASASREDSDANVEVNFSVAIMADSHVSDENQDLAANIGHLGKALDLAKSLGVDKIIHVGDITNFGATTNLNESKKALDAAVAGTDISYHALPGDRDLAQALGNSNFQAVFGNDRQTFTYKGQKFVLLNNSANYTLIPQETIVWFAEQVKDADFVILSQPLYTEGLLMFNYLYMGSTQDEPATEELKTKQKAVLAQRNELLTYIRSSNVKAVIAGDHHKSSKTEDLSKPGLWHYVVGAVGGTLNEYSQKALQSQRFSILKIYSDGAFTLDDVTL